MVTWCQNPAQHRGSSQSGNVDWTLGPTFRVSKRDPGPEAAETLSSGPQGTAPRHSPLWPWCLRGWGEDGGSTALSKETVVPTP